MVTIGVIKEVTPCYFYETNIEKLKSALVKLSELLKETWLNQENRNIAASLFLRIKLKALAIRYFDQGYMQADYEKLVAHIDAMIAESTEKEYTKTLSLAERMRDYVKSVHHFMYDAVEQAARLRDDDWNSLVTSREEAEEIKIIFETKIALANELSDGSDLFGEQVRFMPVKMQLIDDLTAISKFASKVIEDMIAASETAILRAYERPIDERYSDFDYYPMVDESTRVANAVVVCTPIDNEFALFAMAQSRNNAGGFYTIDAATLKGVKEDVIAIFDALRARGANCALFGINDYRGDKKDLYEAALAYGVSGRKVYIHDKTGERSIYTAFLKYIEESAGRFSILNLSYEYLSMPNFQEVYELFDSMGMMTGYGQKELRAEMPFMGFVGLNLTIQAHKLGRPWVQVGKEISRSNQRVSLAYIDVIPMQAQFLDKGWGDYEDGKEGVSTSQKKGDFDYDKVREGSRANIRKIMTSSVSFFAKWGMLVRYCLTHGDDPHLWKTLEREEQAERLTEATQLLMHSMSIPISPVVEVVNKEDAKGWWGLCCDGGKLIKYRIDHVQDLDGIIKTVCHECYHAFQHMATSTGWLEWYWNILGVTKGGLEELRENQHNYMSKGDAYYVQVVETQARAFATDCFNESVSAWCAIGWE